MYAGLQHAGANILPFNSPDSNPETVKHLKLPALDDPGDCVKYFTSLIDVDSSPLLEYLELVSERKISLLHFSLLPVRT